MLNTFTTCQLLLRSVVFVLLLGILFSSTYSSFHSLINMDCLELCDYGDKDTEKDKSEKEKDDKIEMNAIPENNYLYLQALHIANSIFRQSHQFAEINTPPPEWHS